MDPTSDIFQKALLLNEIQLRSKDPSPEAAIAATAPKTVRILYIVPSDVERRPAALVAIHNCAVHLQRWFAGKLDGKSFVLNTPVVQEIASGRSVEWIQKTPTGNKPSLYFWFNVAAEMSRLGLGGFYDPANFWVYYIDAPSGDDQVVGGAGGVALLPKGDVDGVLGQTRQPLCRWVGGLGHELGHAMGLPHPAECDSGQAGQNTHPCQSLMYLGYLTYPNTWFTAEHETRLKADNSIIPINFPQEAHDCSKINDMTEWLPGTPA